MSFDESMAEVSEVLTADTGRHMGASDRAFDRALASLHRVSATSRRSMPHPPVDAARSAEAPPGPDAALRQEGGTPMSDQNEAEARAQRDRKVLADALSRRAQIRLSHEDLHRFLSLPEDLHVVAVFADHRRSGLVLIVAGPSLPPSPPGAEPPYLGGGHLTQKTIRFPDGKDYTRWEWHR